MIGMRMVEREAGGQVGGGQKLRRWQKHRLVHNMTALPREFAVLRRWTIGHSLWWISAVRKLRSSHGCGRLVLRVFFFFCGSVKVLLSFLVFFLAVNYHWTKLFLKFESVKKNRNEAIFRGENRNERQPDNLSGIENKDKSKARLSLGLSRIVHVKKHVIWQSLLSPHFMRTETAVERTKRYKARDSWILVLETTRKMGQNEYYNKV